jgi:aminopeptidase N
VNEGGIDLKVKFWLAFLVVATLTCAGRAVAQVEPQHPYQPGIDVLHYGFTLDLPDTGRSIEGYAEILVRRYLPVTRLRLDLVGLRVDNVWFNARLARFSRDTAGIGVAIDKPFRGRADTFLVAVRYDGQPKDGLIIQSSDPSRWSCFGDNWPNRARYWLPSVDHPSDKATLTWTVRAPGDRNVVANGKLLSRRLLPGTGEPGGRPRAETQWVESRPVPVYVMVVAVGPLVQYDLGLTARGLSEFPPGVPQSVYVLPELLDYLPGPFKEAGPIVEFFAKTVAPFPYEKLAHVQSLTTYGGMENASAIFYSNDIFQRRRMTADLIAHETAHQWFGDAVTPREWGHLWLSEGFATYFQELWVEKSEGNSAFAVSMRRSRDQIVRSRVASERPVVDTLETNLMRLLNTNSYQKGAWVLHMLRGLVGDSVFFRAIRLYYEKHRHGTANSDDLLAAFEESSGRKLGWFFDQWLRRPGFAEITTHWAFDGASRTLRLGITQGERFAPFRFPLTVEVVAEDGTTQQFTLQIPAERATKMEVPVKGTSIPRRLVFDPNVSLLATFRSE